MVFYFDDGLAGLRFAQGRRVPHLSISSGVYEIAPEVDEQDGGGSAVAEDFERLSQMMPAALTRRDGSYVWRSKDDAKAEFRAIDGIKMEGAGFSSIDVVGLAVATGAPNVQFNIATGRARW